ncbi:winged helix-turn-helix DNA-binding domain protein [Vibrio phage 1.054.O._10N.261.52.A1]|nr:winged helix-turn-helix DNA-binding domain protein [Vibrio phage 1.054.O._10N.261.52.A1]
MRKATTGIINWMNCIWLTDLPSNSKYLACYLRKFMNDNQDMAWPSYARMIEETGLSRATVAKYLKLLEQEGWIQRERENGENTTYIAKLPLALEQGVKNLDSSLTELVQQVNGGSLGDELPLVRQLNTNKQVNKQVINNTCPKVKKASLDYDRIKEIFNTTLTNASNVVKLTDKRKKLVKKLFDDFELTYENFESYLAYMNSHPQCQWMFEKRPKNDGSGQFWNAQTFEYFVGEKCFLNVKENL